MEDADGRANFKRGGDRITMEEGYIQLSRRFFRNFLWEEDRTLSRAEAWLDCIQLAAFKNTKRIIDGAAVEVPRGGIVASERFLSDRWRWSRTKVRAFLDLLESEAMIKRQKDHPCTVVLLCKFDQYNPLEKPQKDQRETTERPEKDQIEEGKEGKETPSGRPAESKTPKLSDVQAAAAGIGVEPSIAEIWFNECEARPLSPRGHWTGRDGREIANWQASLKAYAGKWTANQHEQRTRNGKHQSTPRISSANAHNANAAAAGEY